MVHKHKIEFTISIRALTENLKTSIAKEIRVAQRAQRAQLAPIVLVLLLFSQCVFAELPAQVLHKPKTAVLQTNEFVRTIQKEEKIQGVSVSVLINGELVHQQSLGYGDSEKTSAINEKTVFPIASITKLFVSSAVHQLLLEHQVSVDSPIGQILNDVPLHWQSISIKALLSHTSGIPDYYPLEPYPVSVDAALKLVSRFPLEYKTGTQSQYIQTGFALLHRLLEHLSGMSLQEYLQQEHFTKFNLRQTFYDSPERDNTDISQVYRATWTGVEQAHFVYPEAVYASAGINASIADITTWMMAFLKGDVLPLATINKVWQAVPLQNGESSGFSLGWEYWEAANMFMVGHGGANTSEVRHFIHKVNGDSVTVIWLSNTLGFDPHEAVNRIASFFIEGVPICDKFLFWRVNCR